MINTGFPAKIRNNSEIYYCVTALDSVYLAPCTVYSYFVMKLNHETKLKVTNENTRILLPCVVQQQYAARSNNYTGYLIGE